MLDNYERMWGEKPREFSAPLEKNDHPELDDSPLLELDGIQKYQSMVGSMQWAVTLGRIDILTALMTMSRFRVAPRVKHLERLKRMIGYLKKFKHATIRVLTDEPDYSVLPEQNYDWDYSIYGKVSESIPDDIPEALGKPVTLTHFVDANLYHDLVTGRAITGILHLANKTPVDWFSKRQGTVETATYGSELVAARIATDEIIDLRTTLHYLGAPVCDQSFMFSDNQSVITNVTILHSMLSKHHNALSYHHVREAIAAKFVCFHKIDGSKNLADVLSKHCGYPQAWPLLKPLLFWSGDTADIPNSKLDDKKVPKVPICTKGESQLLSKTKVKLD